MEFALTSNCLATRFTREGYGLMLDRSSSESAAFGGKSFDQTESNPVWSCA